MRSSNNSCYEGSELVPVKHKKEVLRQPITEAWWNLISAQYWFGRSERLVSSWGTSRISSAKRIAQLHIWSPESGPELGKSCQSCCGALAGSPTHIRRNDDSPQRFCGVSRTVPRASLAKSCQFQIIPTNKKSLSLLHTQGHLQRNCSQFRSNQV